MIARAKPWMRAVMAVLAVGWILANDADAGSGSGTHLIMVEQAGCRYCIEWDHEIAPKYPQSAEGRFAPLRRVKRGDPVLQSFKPVIYTPTFLVVQNGVEVGRVTGYAGKLFFWEELDEQLAKAGFKPDWSIPEIPPGPRGAGIVGGQQLVAAGSAWHDGH